MRLVPPHWQENNMREAIDSSLSIREALIKMGLKGAGGNYRQFEQYLAKYQIDCRHFIGKGWSKGKSIPKEPIYSIEEILVENGTFNAHKLKNRLFKEGIKEAKCEECGWQQVSEDGRVPVELDHINGDHSDNRLVNLRILCPNCHSLKPTHRGSNKRLRNSRSKEKLVQTP